MSGSLFDHFRFALGNALEDAKDESIISALIRGAIDRIKVTALVLGTVVTLSMVSLFLISETNVFQLIATPLASVLSLFGIPAPESAVVAILVSGIEQVSAAAIVADTSAITRFFVTIYLTDYFLRDLRIYDDGFI